MPGPRRERWSIRVVLLGALIEEIDARVGQRHRSQFIAEAVEERLRRLRQVEAFEWILESPDGAGIPEWGTRESASDWVNGLRQEWDRETSPESIVGEESREQGVLDALGAEFRRRRVEAFEAVAGSLRDADVPGWETPEATDRWVRKQRRACEEHAEDVPGSG